MSKLLFFFCLGLGFFASAQEKKMDSIKTDSVIYEYKERWYYPFGSGLSPKSFEKKPAKNNTKKRKVKQPPKKTATGRKRNIRLLHIF